MKILYADLSEYVAKKLEMPNEVKYVEYYITLEGNSLHVHNGDVLYVREKLHLDKYDTELKLTKLDSRYYLEYGTKNTFLYNQEFVLKNKKARNLIAPYSKFIKKYFDRDDIEFCYRCKFGIFYHLSEDNHGGFYYECDKEQACLAPVLQEFDIQCEWCDYKLCGACESDTFDNENVGFNILLSAIVLFDAINCEYEEFAQLMEDFPDKNKNVQKLIKYISEHITFEDPKDWWRNIYTVNDYHSDFSSVIEFLKKYQLDS